jgi:Flp pilus assembly protein TadD
MVYSVLPAQVSSRQLLAQGSERRRWIVFALLLTLVACSSGPARIATPIEIAPLEMPGQKVALEDVAFIAPTPDLLALDQQMEAFVEQYTSGLGSQRQRLHSLHRAMSGAGMLHLQYDPFAEGSAVEAFHSGSVNCLSYAHLFVAMAREAGLKAHYQWVDVRPLWSRLGERVAVRLHVNVVVRLRHGEEYMADIDPLQPRDVVGTHTISDRDAQALYHSNLAMAALGEEQLLPAWGHAVRAVQLSPKMAHLWVNLGAVYRLAGQHSQAEQSYLHALALKPLERSAMTNLSVLYEMEGRTEEQEHWQRQIAQYRDSNPYYHASLGDMEGEKGNWSGALEHYQQALSLSGEDSRLLFATGLIYRHMRDYEAASALILRAIEHATLRAEKSGYQVQLAAVQREYLATL